MRLFLALLLAAGWLRAAPALVNFDYPDDAAAAKAWRKGEGAPDARVTLVDGKPVLRLDCPFSRTTGPRLLWDLRLGVDLSASQGLRLELRCLNPRALGQLMVYLETPSGWHSVPISPRRLGDWTSLVIRKDTLKAEGGPGGWDQVRTLRLAAFPAGEGDTALELRGLHRQGELGVDTDILVVAAGDGQDRYDTKVARLLAKEGIQAATVAADRLDAATLARARLAILPNNPNLPPEAVRALESFMKKGGKLLAGYATPGPLLVAGGFAPGPYVSAEPRGRFASIRALPDVFPDAPPAVAQASWNIMAHRAIPGRSKVLAEWFDDAGRPTHLPAVLASESMVVVTHVVLEDDPDAKARLLLALAGRLHPPLWRQAIDARVRGLDELGEFPDFAAACAAALTLPGANEASRGRIQAARAARAAVAAQAAAGRFTEALAAADEAARAYQEGYCQAHPGKPDELRGVWCHRAQGVRGMTWEQAAATLKANGFNTLMPNLLWGGVAYYPSQVLPVAPAVAGREDPLAACLAAARRHGLQVHVWKVDWNLGRDAPAAFVAQLRAERRLQASDAGVEQPWLCPSDPRNLALERDALVEVARNYPIDGIHFDYMRYPDGHHCFCDPCRKRFEQATGREVVRWPADVKPRGVRREDWIAWCQENINTLVRTTSDAVRRARPGLKVSAAVFPQWDTDSRLLMQDWRKWCALGWVDFVCPMDYTESDPRFADWVRRQRDWAGPAGLVPGIGVTTSHGLLTPDAVMRQIEITREQRTRGFILFNYGEREAKETIPLLGLGLRR
jgi:uncharacterized lipoprotein YddW (UPF0748 family)